MPTPSRLPLGPGYQFRYIKKRPSVKGGLLLFTHQYRFKTQHNRVYLVDVEQYKHDIFIVKFYLKNHKGSPNRFSLTTKSFDEHGKAKYDNDGWRILSTCLQIMLSLRAEYPKMSGGFIGASLEGEGKILTKRFRIWSQAALTFFNPEHYNHYSNPNVSTYFIENKQCGVPNMLAEAGRMFQELYIDQGGLFSENGPSRVG
jgi:hypothetical protein